MTLRTSFTRFLVTSGSNLAVLGESWEPVEILMDFMSTPGTQEIQEAGNLEVKVWSGGPEQLIPIAI